jgi:glutamine synthetase
MRETAEPPAQDTERQLADIEQAIDEHGIELVRFETPDLNGVSRGKTIAADHFRHYVTHGLALVSDVFCWDHECWVATGTGFGEDITFADLVMRADLSTFRILPHVTGQARVICDMEHPDGQPVLASPRHVLRQVVERAAELGLRPLMQAEYEFYLLDAGTLEPPFGGTDITTTLTNQRLPVLPRLMRTLPALGLRPNTLNQEWGPTQYELNFDPGWDAAAGDQAFTYKTYAKEIAAQDGLLMSFMSKPFATLSGSSCHLHVSLFDESGANVFADPDAPNGVSDRFLWAIGGQLAHGTALGALLAPTVNCPKRYKRGTYAPASLTWGYENRSVAVRVKAWRGERTHIENRLGCGSSNPYLAFAAMLAACLDGIEHKINPGDPLVSSAYRMEDLETLPPLVDDMLAALVDDTALLSYFPASFVKAFRALKEHEIAKAREACDNYGTEQWGQEVTEWERAQFLKMA